MENNKTRMERDEIEEKGGKSEKARYLSRTPSESAHSGVVLERKKGEISQDRILIKSIGPSAYLV
jgi:hypothetical protein